jgi:flavin-dependent dehydrogenase
MISAPHQTYDADIVIIGGGPAGSTVASYIRKFAPELSVLVLEKEKFPREHIGESQLPGISAILHEIGVWDKVEAANFPIKLGASYTWGRNADLWDFDFYPAEEFVDEPRPAQYKGQRLLTAFQVERDRYDDILLRHSESLGATVREETHVREVLRDGDRVTGLRLDDGSVVTGRHYVDASGHVGILRRGMGVESDAPDDLKNVAFWDYWDNAEWAVTIGVGGTRVQVRSLPYGWIWFIPVSPSRASVGLVCPSEYYKSTGLTPAEVYHKAINEQADIRHLLRDARSVGGKVYTTKNWSQLSDRLYGENWWICGEAAGFADPILAAGMTLAHGSARDLACTIMEIERGAEDAAWLRSWYDEKSRRNIDQHIRFAKYWYAANACFTDLQDYCRTIAKDAGLRLTPQQAWRWLAQGGFATENIHSVGFGSFDFGSAKGVIERLSGGKAKFVISQYNEFHLNLNNATEILLGNAREGRVDRVPCYRRADATLPNVGDWKVMIDLLRTESDLKTIYERLLRYASALPPAERSLAVFRHLQVLEAMVAEGWVLCKLNKKRPTMSLELGGRIIRDTEEARKALENAKGTISFNLPEVAPS